MGSKSTDNQSASPDILIKTGEEARVQTGLPDPVVKILAQLSKYHPISIRGTPLTKSPNQRYNEKFYPKPTSIHQKSSSKPPGIGHITEQEALSRAGLDLTDHTFGKLPKNRKPISTEEMDQFNFDNHAEIMPGSHLLNNSISTIDGRLCYETETPHFKKIKTTSELPSNITVIEYGSKDYYEAAKRGFNDSIIISYKGSKYQIDNHDPIAKKCYIQETEYLSDIMERINQGEYQISNFDEKTGILKYRYPSDTDLTFKGEFEISLSNPATLHAEGTTGLWEEPGPKYPPPIDGFNTDPEMQKLEEFIKKNPDLSTKAYGVTTISTTGKRLPLMVQAGENGYPVTGDLDSMHFSIHGDLKIPELESALETENTYTDKGRDVFSSKIRTLRDKITAEPFSSRPELAIFQTFKKQKVPDPTAKDGFKIEDPLDEYLTEENIKALGKLTLGSFLFNCAANKALETPMFQHGEESFNPGNSESFDANYFFYKGKVYHIDNEESYLAFLFHDHDYLANHYINIHKSCFRERQPAEAHLTEMWIDLVRFQVVIGGFGDQIKKENLNKEYDNAVRIFNEKPENVNNKKPYFSDLEKIRNQKNIKKLGEEIKKIDAIYNTHGERTRNILPSSDTFEEMAKMEIQKNKTKERFSKISNFIKKLTNENDSPKSLILSPKKITKGWSYGNNVKQKQQPKKEDNLKNKKNP
jgi:hypothetical protein